MDAYSIDNPACVNAVGAERIRSSVGRISRFRDRSFRREIAPFQLNPRTGLFLWQICWFFPIHRRGGALLIDLTAHCLAIIRRRISVTENYLIQLFFESCNQRRKQLKVMCIYALNVAFSAVSKVLSRSLTRLTGYTIISNKL